MMSALRPLLAAGMTERTERYVVVYGSLSPGYGQYQVTVDGRRWEVVRVDRMRDGGTTEVTLSSGSQGGGVIARLVFPNRLGSDDRTPRLDGERVERHWKGEDLMVRALQEEAR